jgi:hypothetical protein
VLSKVELTAERTLLEVARVAFADIRKVVDNQGNPVPLHFLDDDTVAAIVSVKWKEGTPEYRLADKNTALGHALKALGLLRERVEVEDKTPAKNMDVIELARRVALMFAKATHMMGLTAGTTQRSS